MADKEDIDFTELERELEAAIDQDTRYWLQNDAKIRAVNQRVASYDEFRLTRLQHVTTCSLCYVLSVVLIFFYYCYRDIVKAAHLKPLKKKDTSGSSDTSSSRSGFVWNSIASGKKRPTSDRQDRHDMENDVYPVCLSLYMHFFN